MSGPSLTLTLDLDQLGTACALSPGNREYVAEAARVLLQRHEHPTPAVGSWTQEAWTLSATVYWTAPTVEMIQTHGNEKDATEAAAYAVAVALVPSFGYRVIGRTAQGSGSDWWMVRPGEGDEIIYKLEVSGISERGSVTTRLENKAAQGQRGTLRRPGVAVVVRFKDIQIQSQAWS